MKLEYPAVIFSDEADGFMAQAPDIPEAFGYGAHEEEALEELARSIALALYLYIQREKRVPEPSETQPDEYLCRLTMPDSARVALLWGMTQHGMSLQGLAQHLELEPEEADNLLDLSAPLDFVQMEQALLLVGIDYEIKFYFEIQGHS